MYLQIQGIALDLPLCKLVGRDSINAVVTNWNKQINSMEEMDNCRDLISLFRYYGSSRHVWTISLF